MSTLEARTAAVVTTAGELRSLPGARFHVGGSLSRLMESGTPMPYGAGPMRDKVVTFIQRRSDETLARMAAILAFVFFALSRVLSRLG